MRTVMSNDCASRRQYDVGSPRYGRYDDNGNTETGDRDALRPKAESSRHARTVVAIVIRRFDKIALLKRSAIMTSDAGLWHCITGYLEPMITPERQAAIELLEETGLHTTELDTFRTGPILTIPASTTIWQIHPFLAETTHRQLQLNWEHERYRWIKVSQRTRYQRVGWLEDVLSALQLLKST